jgi:1-phosphofructokinase family hexose kinase
VRTRDEIVKGDCSIVTVGLSPAWDVTYSGRDLRWGEHKHAAANVPQPAGKAMNISRALAWMGERSIAAGLWGRDDYRQMLEALRQSGGLIKARMTPAEGGTRLNVSVVDTANQREMHLRLESRLASRKALRQLKADLSAPDRNIRGENSICVFAGAMPEDKVLDDVVMVARSCHRLGAGIAVDTWGKALCKLVDTGVCRLIKPNVEELRELLGEDVADRPVALARAGRVLLGKVEIVLISRGEKGAVVVAKDGAWSCRAARRGKSVRIGSTVGCGDYLLAGFLKGLKDKAHPADALVTAVKVATAKAWGWTDTKNWHEVQRRIRLQTVFLRGLQARKPRQ